MRLVLAQLALRGVGRFFLGLTVGALVLLVELIDPAGRVDKLDRASVIRVALRANFHRDLGLGAARLERVPAAASHGAFLIFGVNSVLHRSRVPSLVVDRALAQSRDQGLSTSL